MTEETEWSFWCVACQQYVATEATYRDGLAAFSVHQAGHEQEVA